MDYFELGKFRGDKITNTTGYNKAFSEFRRETAAKWLGPAVITVAVSYTHLDVYKRQGLTKKSW